MRAAKLVLFGLCLACFGGQGLSSFAGALADIIGDDDDVASFPSPDNRYNAVVFLSQGGGPATSYCSDAIYLFPGRSERSGTLLYVALCGGLPEGHWSESVKWKSSIQFEIACNPGFWAPCGNGHLIVEGHHGAPVLVTYTYYPGGGSW